jgi:MerR family mercuric resistance operon transcriptional regulator
MKKTFKNTFTIKKAAQKAGVGVETIRFYERKGLIEETIRSESGYRLFTLETVKRVRFIKHTQELGFSLRDINNSLTARNDVYQKTLEKIQLISLKIDSLQKIKASLNHLAACCKGEGSIEDCPIIEAFETGSETQAKECNHDSV